MSTPDQRIDDLVELIATGDRSALAALYDLAGPRFFRHFCETLADARRAEEATLRAFVDIWVNAPRRSSAAPISSWLDSFLDSHTVA